MDMKMAMKINERVAAAEAEVRDIEARHSVDWRVKVMAKVLRGDELKGDSKVYMEKMREVVKLSDMLEPFYDRVLKAEKMEERDEAGSVNVGNAVQRWKKWRKRLARVVGVKPRHVWLGTGQRPRHICRGTKQGRR